MVKSVNQTNLPRYHESVDDFRAAINYTSREAGFNAILIEKDYYCSLLLAYLYADKSHNLVFKGGTCLNKVYAPFYRLSEDLDFSIPISSNKSREDRRKAIEPVKKSIATLKKQIPTLVSVTAPRGHNESRQYTLTVEYQSCLLDEPGTIEIEVGLREQLIEKAFNGPAKTILEDPFKEKAAIPDISVVCLGKSEAYAEKVRAALTRREPAIRDFYDIFHADQRNEIDLADQQFLRMVKNKLTVPGTDQVDVSKPRIAILRDQLEAELKPVLRQVDYEKFDLEQAIQLVRVLAAAI
jgi:predicted nucleotidyltransferase component of viral defense system